MRLKDKVAIITGGSSGIGREIALRYGQEGAKVVVANRTRETGLLVAEEIKGYGGTAISYACNVTKSVEVTAMVNSVTQEFGAVDILVADAGTLVNKPIEELSEADWDSTIDTNLKGVFLCVRSVVPMMKKAGAGKIILIGSIAGALGYANGAAYCASKGGVLNMMRALTAELASFGINVNALSPGATATPMNAEHRADEEILALFSKNTPTGRDFVPPKDMTGSAVFLASEDSNAVHGVNLLVDDGFSAVKPV
ncbi:SDR family NAD(P)-dependent oxidoreductase [Pseudomonadota bacterium]